MAATKIENERIKEITGDAILDDRASAILDRYSKRIKGKILGAARLFIPDHQRSMIVGGVSSEGPIGSTDLPMLGTPHEIDLVRRGDRWHVVAVRCPEGWDPDLQPMLFLHPIDEIRDSRAPLERVAFAIQVGMAVRQSTLASDQIVWTPWDSAKSIEMLVDVRNYLAALKLNETHARDMLLRAGKSY